MNTFDLCVRTAMMPPDEGGSGLTENEALAACGRMAETLWRAEVLDFKANSPKPQAKTPAPLTPGEKQNAPEAR